MDPLRIHWTGAVVRDGDTCIFTLPLTLAILKQEINESLLDAAAAVGAEMASSVGLINLPRLDCREVAESAGATTNGLFSPTVTK